MSNTIIGIIIAAIIVLILLMIFSKGFRHFFVHMIDAIGDIFD